MKTDSTFLATLRKAGRPFIATREAAALAGLSASAASKHLHSLAEAGLIRRVRQGQWALDPGASAFSYAGWATMPLPSYVSLYSALHHHGIIEQIPRTVFVVSLDRTKVLDTDIGRFSIHQVSPEVFGGYEERDGVRTATAEKAVFDALYLARARSGRFAGLTEVELPTGFDRRRLRAFADRISDPAARRRVRNRIVAFLAEVDDQT